jgi:hypothetical protein
VSALRLMRSHTILLALAAAAPGLAQTAAAGAPPCPPAAQVTQKDLLGLWRAEFPGHAGVSLLLEPNPRWEGSLAGQLLRAGARSEVSGDVERGEFMLEESDDGTRISGTWAGDVVEGSCGREIRGTWHGPQDGPGREFILRWLGPR